MRWETPIGPTRTEHDLIGDFKVPADAYWGVHTGRALQNFPITGRQIGTLPYLLQSFAEVKKACALANGELGILTPELTDAIARACDQVAAGGYENQFVVDPIQGGAGTSTNMNANEIIANVALEILGEPKGNYSVVHPLQHVNASQSTNDVYPTAARIAVWRACSDLLAEMAALVDAFHERAQSFGSILKMGRTQLQDAVPMTLGQEFQAYSITLDEDAQRLRESRDLLLEVSLGGTAIGTGINTPAGYQELVVTKLKEVTGLPITRAADNVEATPDTGALLLVHGVFKRIAVKISKTCSDLRLLSSGPRAGFGEINLPAAQAGSSIMPGKVNPVIPEVMNQIAYEVMGHDFTIAIAAESAQLQLNAFEPVMFKSLFDSAMHLTGGFKVLRERCVTGITANAEFLARQVHSSIGLATALGPVLGYEMATQIAVEALRTGESVIDIVVDRKLLSRAQVRTLLTPEKLAHPHGQNELGE